MSFNITYAQEKPESTWRVNREDKICISDRGETYNYSPKSEVADFLKDEEIIDVYIKEKKVELRMYNKKIIVDKYTMRVAPSRTFLMLEIFGLIVFAFTIGTINYEKDYVWAKKLIKNLIAFALFAMLMIVELYYF